MTLMPYQQQGVDWLRSRPRSLLGDEQGLGKTAQAVTAIRDSPLGTVVVCPATLKSNWARELAMWSGIKPIVLDGRESWRFPKPGEAIILNYEILPDWLYQTEQIGTKQKPKERWINPAVALMRGWIKKYPLNLVLDEVHYCKNPDTERTRKATALSLCVTGCVIGMTGTPLANKPGDLFGVLDTLGLTDEFGFRHLSGWRTWWGGHWHQWGRRKPEWQWNCVVPTDCASRLKRVMLRRMKRDVLTQLPSKRYFNRYVDLPYSLHRQLDAECGTKIKNLVPGEMPQFNEFSAARSAIAAAKIPAMMEFIEEYEDAGEPLCVYSANKAPIVALGKRPGWAVITGDVPHAVRQKNVDDFQAGRLKGIGFTVAGAAGITLTNASTMLEVSADWTPGTNSQAHDRIHRIGQSKDVRVFRLVANHPLDEHVYETLDMKQGVITAAIDAARRV